MTVLADAKPEDAGLSSSGLDAVDAGLQALIDKGELAGAVTLVARHGKVARRSILGLDNRGKYTPLKRDTIFRIYSMTKPVTAVAMMILWDRGLWQPDDPIEKHLPQFKGVRVFDGLDADGKPKTVPADHPPTLRELLTHTAGLTYGWGDADIDKIYRAAHIWGGDSLADFAERVGKLPLVYQPGTKWLYSISMDVQGALIEKLTGESLPDFMQNYIFGPLGMSETGFYVPSAKLDRLAALYRTTSEGGIVQLDKPPMGNHFEPPKAANGGGGLVSTLDDYARFAQMLLNKGDLDGVRVVSPEAVALMSTNQLSDEMMRKGFGIGAQMIRPGFGHGFNCAVFTDPAAAGIPVGKGSFQWDGAAGTWFWVDPANDLIFVGMIQRFQLNPSMANCQQLTQKLIAGALL
ncbi:MAG TPA: serine hydrolase domain-containing protein [Rhizomicrobium sp.]|nr:serine hydrolase domain-containing protein [Rhizomicrobium sp.]